METGKLVVPAPFWRSKIGLRNPHVSRWNASTSLCGLEFCRWNKFLPLKSLLTQELLAKIEGWHEGRELEETHTNKTKSFLNEWSDGGKGGETSTVYIGNPFLGWTPTRKRKFKFFCFQNPESQTNPLEHPQQPFQILLFKITKSTLLVILTAHLFIAHFSAFLLL